MDRITVTRPVVVKVRITDGYKKSYAAQMELSLRRLDAALKHLEAQEKKLPAGAPGDPQRAEFGRERRKHLESRAALLEQSRKVLALPPGAEVLHGRVESLVEVGVGDDWRRVMGIEIVIEDGLVAEIRESGLGENTGA